MIPDQTRAYGSVSRFLHWLMAAGFAFMLFTAAAFNIDDRYFSLMDYHKSVGAALLLLAAVRLVWALSNARRRPAAALPVKIGHGLLYLLMLAVPLTAAVRQYGSARSFSWFGLFDLPSAAEKIEWMTRLGNQWHGNLAWLLFALAGGHILMAVVHQIRGEKIINRMAGPRR